MPEQTTVSLEWAAHQLYALHADERATEDGQVDVAGESGTWDGHLRRARQAAGRGTSAGQLAARLQALEAVFDEIVVRVALDRHDRKPSTRRVDYSRFTANVFDARTGAPRGFVRWFEALKQNGPGQGDPLFDWLAERASIADMTWFLTQEAAGEAGFDDLVAMTQVKLPIAAKLEMARNYWDEMGRGSAGGMHGPMLDALTRELGIPNGGCVVGESLALGNLMTAMAATRSLAFQSVGALGVIELTAPGRARRVNAGLKRLGVGGAARRYFALHATLDVKHSAAWNREVLHTLVMENPATATAIAEGALMRLEAGRRCFEEYRSYLFSRAA